MHYFLLRKKQEFVLFKVKDEHVYSFEELYGIDVLLASDNLIKFLLAFERDWLIDLEWPG